MQIYKKHFISLICSVCMASYGSSYFSFLVFMAHALCTRLIRIISCSNIYIVTFSFLVCIQYPHPHSCHFSRDCSEQNMCTQVFVYLLGGGCSESKFQGSCAPLLALIKISFLQLRDGLSALDIDQHRQQSMFSVAFIV